MPKKLTKYQRQVIASENRIKELFEASRKTGSATFTAYGTDWTIPRETIFASLEQCRWFTDYALVPWGSKNHPEANVSEIVLTESGITNSTAYLPGARGRARIEIEYDDTLGGFREATMLHEAAHLFAHTGGHHAPFQKVLVELYRDFYGEAFARLLGILLYENK